MSKNEIITFLYQNPFFVLTRDRRGYGDYIIRHYADDLIIPIKLNDGSAIAAMLYLHRYENKKLGYYFQLSARSRAERDCRMANKIIH